MVVSLLGTSVQCEQQLDVVLGCTDHVGRVDVVEIEDSRSRGAYHTDHRGNRSRTL